MSASGFTVRPRVVACRRVPIELTGGSFVPVALLGLLFAVYSSSAPPLLVVGAGFLGGFGGAASLVVHELGHVAAARRLEGVRPLRVSLLWLGAGTKFEGAYRSGRDQARVALAGPAASLVFAAVVLVVALMPMPRPVQLGLFGLSILNAAVAVLSLVPVYPLDGYKLVVGLLWRALGSERRAHSVLHRAGRVSIGLELLGCLILLFEQPVIGAIVLLLGGVVLLQKKIGSRAASQRPVTG